MTSDAGMRMLAIISPPFLRAAATNGAAQAFSKTISAAVVPGARALPASWMSSSPSRPGAGPRELHEGRHVTRLRRCR